LRAIVRLINLIIIVVAILSILPFYTRFKTNAAPIPPGVYLGGLALTELKDTNEIRRHLEQIYMEPIEVRFGEERLALIPAEVDFYLDVEQMIAESGQYLEGSAFVEIAFREMLGLDQRQRDIPIRYMLNSEKLQAWLDGVAQEYNRPPQNPRVILPNQDWYAESNGIGALPEGDLPKGYTGSYQDQWQWAAGTPGYTMDPSENLPMLIQALKQPNQRAVDLRLTETPAQPPSMADLTQSLDSYLRNFPGFGAVYVHDLVKRTEAHIDSDVSFSGMSTLKIAIVAALMQRTDGLPADDPDSVQLGQWIDFALGESNNFAANMLIREVGDSQMHVGVRRITDFMAQLGFVNTYMQSGYDFKTQLPEIPTPGNQHPDWHTNPDSNLQTTTAEMGYLLTTIYDCAQGGGLLIQTFGSAFTPQECEAILFYMGHDQFQELLWAGLPNPREAWIVHKHGFAFESHSDVALVWGPTGPYVITVFLYRPGWLDWTTSNRTMKDISRITWNYFAFQQHHAMAQGEAIERESPIMLQSPPAYVALPEAR